MRSPLVKIQETKKRLFSSEKKVNKFGKRIILITLIA